jgi:nitrite reductase (NADH) large subunit
MITGLPARQSLVVIGNGMAGMRTVEELLKLEPDHYDITVFGAEPHGNYNRILLSPVLAGDKKMEDIMLHTRQWYVDNNITLFAGDPVVHIDRRRRLVRAKSGREVWYDRLLLATGSTPFIVPVPGHTLPGVIGFGTSTTSTPCWRQPKTAAMRWSSAAACWAWRRPMACMRRGMDVTVVHVTDSLMNQQLDKPAANLLKLALENKGLRFLLDTHTSEIVGGKSVTGVRFKDGSEIPADLVVMAAGVRPNIELAKEAVSTANARSWSTTPCRPTTRASTRWASACSTAAPPSAWWPRSGTRPKCAAPTWQAPGHRRYVQQATPTKLKVTGVDLYSVGDFIGGEGSEDLVLRDPRRGIYKRLVLNGNRIAGAVLYGDVQDGPWYFGLIQDRTDISAMRSRLLFGEALCAAA